MVIVKLSCRFDFDKRKDVLAFGREEKVRPVIKEYIKHKKNLKVRYWGGSQPGVVRELYPINLTRDDCKVSARCTSSNARKLYLLSKMELVSREELDSYSTKCDETFDQLAQRHIHLLFQFNVFKAELRDGEIQVFESFKNNRSQYKTYPFLTIHSSSLQKGFSYKFSIAGWSRSFTSIEEAIAYTVYYLKLAQEAIGHRVDKALNA